MSEEIKEVLNELVEYFKESDIDCFGDEKDKLISYEEAQILLDCITNLQQENKRIKNIWKDTNVIIKDDKELVMNTNAYDYLIELEDRIDKAIKYIDTHIIEDSEYNNYMQCEREEKEELLNILNSDKE